jgi:hypothetical protein
MNKNLHLNYERPSILTLERHLKHFVYIFWRQKNIRHFSRAPKMGLLGQNYARKFGGEAVENFILRTETFKFGEIRTATLLRLKFENNCWFESRQDVSF